MELVTSFVTHLPDDTFYEYIPKLPASIHIDDVLYKELWELHPEKMGGVTVWGHDAPRYMQTFGKDYTFSKKSHPATPLDKAHPFLLKLLKFTNEISDGGYNGILINWYPDGNSSIGKHSDSEKELVPNSSIYSYSFGQARDFIIRHKEKKIEPITLSLADNSLLIMGEGMQTNYTHELPKRAISKCPNSRINITIRKFQEK